ncbi:MAG TPA: hypothetical protein VG013_15890 [Gemmataceae bacterium]|jgi:ElaB/YqjD/DUF883 family membrane-anchored ribosome-binding protein|nr:hypothetical protein [Gemmataceae bacterium]
MAGPSRTPGSAKDKGESTGTVGQAAAEAKGKVQEAASAMAQQAQDTASAVGHKAKDVASNVAQKAKDAASTAAHKTDDALSTVGDKMTSLAGTIRESAPHEGTMGSAATMVADRLQAGGHYLQEHGLHDMTEDVGTLIRRYPVQSLLVGVGIGFLLGCISTRG